MNKTIQVLVGLILSIIFLVACNDVSTPDSVGEVVVEKNLVNNHVKVLQVTIIPKDKQVLSNGTYTFDDVNTEDGRTQGEDIAIDVLVQEVINGKTRSNLLGYGLTSANGRIEQRGQSARLSQAKSYEIDLLKSGGLFHGQEVINLNKHPFDPTMMRNKISFDLIDQMPHLMGFKVDFIELKVKDMNKLEDTFKSYGLFSHVEELDDYYFDKRPVKKPKLIYKAENFEFFRYPEALKTTDDSAYNEKLFETRLAIEGDDDHQGLFEMLEAVNNPLIPINDTLDEYFDKENYVSWLAMNILLSNIDTASRNYYIYQDVDDGKWRFIPWDYDKGLGAYDDDRMLWQRGVSNYWGSVLHQRFLKNDDNRKLLTEEIESLYSGILSEENVEFLVEAYRPVVKKYLNRSPDLETFGSYKTIEPEINSIHNSIYNAYHDYYRSLKKPLPFFLGKVVNQGNYITFKWSDSYDFNRESISYYFEISTTADMSNIIYSKEDIKDTQLVIDPLEPGTYYYKVTAINESGLSQESFDFYIDQSTNTYYYGVHQLIITD